MGQNSPNWAPSVVLRNVLTTPILQAPPPPNTSVFAPRGSEDQSPCCAPSETSCPHRQRHRQRTSERPSISPWLVNGNESCNFKPFPRPIGMKLHEVATCMQFSFPSRQDMPNRSKQFPSSFWKVAFASATPAKVRPARQVLHGSS